MLATVRFADEQWVVAPGAALSFGRGAACTIVLDATDVGISRLAGSVEIDAGSVWLTNRSTTRPLQVVDQLGMRSVLAPGRRFAVDEPITIVVEGQLRRHAVAVDVAVDARPGAPAPVARTSDAPTDLGFAVSYTAEDRLALVALFAGYLREFPRHDAHPRSYADAAAVLGWPRTTLVKRIEHLRSRLTRAGVPGLLGDNALETLAEYALTTRIVTRDDLALLEP